MDNIATEKQQQFNNNIRVLAELAKKQPNRGGKPQSHIILKTVSKLCYY